MRIAKDRPSGARTCRPVSNSRRCSCRRLDVFALERRHNACQEELAIRGLNADARDVAGVRMPLETDLRKAAGAAEAMLFHQDLPFAAEQTGKPPRESGVALRPQTLSPLFDRGTGKLRHPGGRRPFACAEGKHVQIGETR